MSHILVILFKAALIMALGVFIATAVSIANEEDEDLRRLRRRRKVKK